MLCRDSKWSRNVVFYKHECKLRRAECIHIKVLLKTFNLLRHPVRNFNKLFWFDLFGNQMSRYMKFKFFNDLERKIKSDHFKIRSTLAFMEANRHSPYQNIPKIFSLCLLNKNKKQSAKSLPEKLFRDPNIPEYNTSRDFLVRLRFRCCVHAGLGCFCALYDTTPMLLYLEGWHPKANKQFSRVMISHQTFIMENNIAKKSYWRQSVSWGNRGGSNGVEGEKT